jgi:hypothetical protein
MASGLFPIPLRDLRVLLFKSEEKFDRNDRAGSTANDQTMASGLFPFPPRDLRVLLFKSDLHPAGCGRTLGTGVSIPTQKAA